MKYIVLILGIGYLVYIAIMLYKLYKVTKDSIKKRNKEFSKTILEILKND